MDPMSMALSGLGASARQLAVGANNLANLNTRDYKAKRLDLEDQAGGGVRPAALRESEAPAVPEGSNVDLPTELVGQMLPSVAYKANLEVILTQDQMTGQALDLKA